MCYLKWDRLKKRMSPQFTMKCILQLLVEILTLFASFLLPSMFINMQYHFEIILMRSCHNVISMRHDTSEPTPRMGIEPAAIIDEIWHHDYWGNFFLICYHRSGIYQIFLCLSVRQYVKCNLGTFFKGLN